MIYCHQDYQSIKYMLDNLDENTFDDIMKACNNILKDDFKRQAMINGMNIK